MSDHAKRITGLSPEKLDRLLKQIGNKTETKSVNTIQAQRRDGQFFPLSFAQQRLWFLDQLDPDSSTYNEPVSIQITGAINKQALVQSLNEIVQRHEVLRTTFRDNDGQPVQVIVPSLTLPLPIIRLAPAGDKERESQIYHLATQEARRPFDLSRGPLLRIALVELGEQEHILLLTIHHIVFDGWSMGVFVRELAALYEAFSLAKPSPLPLLPIQYADFAVWQREWIKSEVRETQLAYWKKQLAYAPATLGLLTDRPRSSAQTSVGARFFVSLPKALTEALVKLSRDEDVTLFMTCLTALQILLYRYTNQADILVGTVVANRNRSEIKDLIGFFANTLVLRADLAGNPTFRQLLGRVRQVAWEAFANQDIPFDMLVDELQIKRDISYHPLFQVMFILHNEPLGDLHLPDLKLQVLPVHTLTSKRDLSLALYLEPQGLVGHFDYNTDLFDTATIERMAGHLQTILESIVANRDLRLTDIPVLTQVERRQILAEWNNPGPGAFPDQCIHHLFEKQVERTPDAVAVVFEDEQINYRELNQRSNQLAHYLQSLGVGPETAVGLYMERSVNIIIGLLGILKAGGVYVPLDPIYPVERLVQIIENVRAPIVLTQQSLAAVMPVGEIKMICLDECWGSLAQESDQNPYSGVTAANLVYVMYTSGSTGKPKGVAVEHRQIVNYVTSVVEKLSLPTDADFAMVSTFAAGLGYTMLFPSLCIGGRLHLISQERAKDAEAMADYSRLHNLDCLKITPSHLTSFLTHSQPESVLPRQRLVFGGEAIHWDTVQRIRQLAPACLIFNHYGSTEITVGILTCPAGDRPAPHTSTLPLGRPLDNVQVYLLGAHMELVPVGVPGEIYVGGANLTRGYLHQPDLTADRFVPNPFADNPGARIYRTGDMACYLSDGTIEFLGRRDYQVKIRGYRVELQEIEAVLKKYPGLHSALVITREDRPGDKRLVAYMVPNKANFDQPDDTVNLITQVRRFVERYLPEYMIPSAFVLLDQLPLTPNGKIDRNALPVPDQKRPDLEKAFVAPRTPVEEIIAEIWAKVLAIKQVGVDDDFFELGGHSLLATQAVTQVRKAFRTELALRSLFEFPTVAGLADLLIKHESSPGQIMAAARLRKRLMGMSPDEISALLQEKKKAKE